MPKVNWCVPQRQREIAEELRERYGGMMTASDVMRELGLNHDAPTTRWLEGVPAVIVNNRKRYRVSDIASKIYRESV